MSHTPGPWALYPETDGTEICAVTMSPGLPIRQLIARPERGPNWIANAFLIAAAPEMLAALEALIRHDGETENSLMGLDHDSKALENAKRAAEAAILKAKGT